MSHHHAGNLLLELLRALSHSNGGLHGSQIIWVVVSNVFYFYFFKLGNDPI